MIELDEVSQEVTLKNFSDVTTVDVSGYYMCRAPGTYAALSALTIIGGGDLDLSPGEEVTIVYTAILSAGTGIGLYLNNLGFGNHVNMADYMQYKGVAGFRESVAVSAGLWTAGTFASGASGPYFYNGDGTQNGAGFWSAAPAPVPTIGFWGIALLVVVVIASAMIVERRRRGI